MRKLITLLLIAGFFSAGAAPKNTYEGNDGVWNRSSNWSLNRLPIEKDTVIIPTNKTLTLGLNETIDLKDVVLKVYGTINMYSLSEINLDASAIFVHLGGRIAKRTYLPWGSPEFGQAITVGNVNVFNANTIVGPQMVNQISKTFISFVEGASPLPVKYIGFNAARKSNDVLIQWATAQEVNAAVYEVQRSLDGTNWNAIGSVKATGTTNTITNYSYTDKNVSAFTAYYRIKQVDADNRFEYTAVRTVKADATGAAVSVAGARGNIVVQFPEKVRGQVEVRLVSLGGQIVSRQVINQPLGQVIIPASVKGNYIVMVADQQDIKISKQILL